MPKVVALRECFGLTNSWRYITSKYATTAISGNHYCNMLVDNYNPDEDIDIALEFYAGHYVIGTQPFETEVKSDFRYTFDGVYICTKNQDILDFILDLWSLINW